MQDNNWNNLIAEAVRAREKAYAPYSGFKVGAAILTADGQVYQGCNVENAAYGDTICAERVALVSAVAAGRQQFLALAVVADTAQPVTPCGSCRQVLAEFAPDLKVICTNLKGDVAVTDLPTLLPSPFIHKQGV